MCTAGFLEAYTYILKGGVFANAQTGNMALLALAIADGNFMRAIFCIIPMLAYIVGILLTLSMPKRLQKGVRWETIFVLFQILVFLLIGCCPVSVPHAVSTISVSFICAIQYNTFTKAHGIPMATTFCTNNLRQAVINFYHAVHRTDADASRKAWFFVRHLLCFLVGALVGGILCKLLAERAIWVNAVCLLPVAIVMLASDIQRKNTNGIGDSHE